MVLLTGVDAEALAMAMVGLQFDLPGAVAVRHRIDVERGVLRRVVSDVTGVVEEAERDLEHACVSCALREDVLPTLERVARSGRWTTIISHLPVGAQADQVCAVLAQDTRLARHLRVSAVISVVDGGRVLDDLLGEDLLAERGAHAAHDDRRGVAEVACAMVELADVTVTVGAADETSVALLRSLARPGSVVVAGTEHLDSSTLAGQLHHHASTLTWTHPAFEQALPRVTDEGVWRLDLRSPHPLHPARLLDGLEQLGGGRHRSRGSFWLPTRPGRLLVWDGAGGQLSVGDADHWGARTPRTRIVIVGVGAPPPGLREAFESFVLEPDEASGTPWRVSHDGFEPWLGEIRGVA